MGDIHILKGFVFFVVGVALSGSANAEEVRETSEAAARARASISSLRSSLSEFGTQSGCPGQDTEENVLLPHLDSNRQCKMDPKLAKDTIESLLRRTAPSRPSAFYLVDPQGRVVQNLHEVDADRQQPVASTQKILTAYIAYKSGLWGESVACTSADVKDPWSMPCSHISGDSEKFHGEPMRMGESVPFPVMIHSLLYDSSNTAANAIARLYGAQAQGNQKKNIRVEGIAMESTMVGMMNSLTAHILKSDQPGRARSLFSDPSGIGLNQYSTPNNMARILAYVTSDQDFMKALKGITETRDGKVIPQTLTALWGGEDQFFKGGLLNVGQMQISSIPVSRCGPGYRVVSAVFGPYIPGGYEAQLTKYMNMNSQLREVLDGPGMIASIR